MLVGGGLCRSCSEQITFEAYKILEPTSKLGYLDLQYIKTNDIMIHRQIIF